MKNIDVIKTEEPKFKNRQTGAAGFVADKIMENAVSKFNQETLEEVAMQGKNHQRNQRSPRQ